ncbi:MAG: hypothetical protein NZ922_02675 [Candidatus Methanomethyliaceae archaeon]|nr:hypothetical protein [Candidatus Methanomethyliaceae archaeon]MDW7970934.1 hypothetical protein [Nitrososphaerota archaeon]
MEKILKSLKRVEEEVSFIENKGREMAREIVAMAEEGAREIELEIERTAKESGRKILSMKMEEANKIIKEIERKKKLESLEIEEKAKKNFEKSVEEAVKIVLEEFKSGDTN